MQQNLFLKCDDNDLAKTDERAHEPSPKCIDLQSVHKILFSSHRRKRATLPFRFVKIGVQKLLLAEIKSHIINMRHSM